MISSHWQEYYRAWSQLGPPLRPHQEVVAAVSAQLATRKGHTLLLGVTPEFANFDCELTAVDLNHPLVTGVWPGNTSTRRAFVGDWRNPNFRPQSFSACVGDGVFSVLRYPDENSLLLHELTRILRRDARFVCRLFLPPETPETPSRLREAAIAGTVQSFHAFKLRLAMALAAERPDPHVPVDSILSCFNRLFADRDELVRTAGWSREQVDTIDFYRGSSVLYSFPTRDQMLTIVTEIFPSARLVPVGTYELAERCPLLVADHR